MAPVSLSVSTRHEEEVSPDFQSAISGFKSPYEPVSPLSTASPYNSDDSSRPDGFTLEERERYIAQVELDRMAAQNERLEIEIEDMEEELRRAGGKWDPDGPIEKASLSDAGDVGRKDKETGGKENLQEKNDRLTDRADELWCKLRCKFDEDHPEILLADERPTNVQEAMETESEPEVLDHKQQEEAHRLTDNFWREHVPDSYSQGDMDDLAHESDSIVSYSFRLQRAEEARDAALDQLEILDQQCRSLRNLFGEFFENADKRYAKKVEAAKLLEQAVASLEKSNASLREKLHAATHLSTGDLVCTVLTRLGVPGLQ